VDLNEVVSIISRYISLSPLGVENIKLINALGRVLAEDIYAPIDHPPFDRSEVDGYAVRAEDTYGADENRPVKLMVSGSIEVGVKPNMEVSKGSAIEIATGAMIPRGANAVVMEEYTSRSNDELFVYKSVSPGENIAFTGSDISLGDLILLKGTLLGSREIGLLAGLGIDRVKVFRKLKVAIYSTGNEVVEPGEELPEGKIYDVNGYLITTSLQELGVDAVFHGRLPDDYGIIYEKLSKTLEEYDVIVTSGGTSAGLGDLVYRVFNSLGKPGVIIHGLAIKPGKPTVVAIVNGKLIFGLPGFPLSCYMVLHKIVKPIIARLAGLRITPVRRIRARLAYRIRKPLGRTWLLPVALVHRKNDLVAYPVSMKSGSISPLVNSDGYAILEKNRDLYLENEIIDVELFSLEHRIPDLVIIGSNDPFIYRILVDADLMDSTRVIVTGSLGGWYAIRRGEADIAPTHLLDEESRIYNIPFMEKLGVRSEAVLIRGYDRRIGIVVAKGNAKNISGVHDFLRDDIVIVNRTRGSGSRVLLDISLKNLAKRMNMDFKDLIRKIKGYSYEVKTHTAVAAAIKQGRADAGIAIEYVAWKYDLDFIPITWEHYDFLIHKDSLNKLSVKRFMEYLRGERIKNLVKKYPGYRIPDDIGNIIAG